MGASGIPSSSELSSTIGYDPMTASAALSAHFGSYYDPTSSSQIASYFASSQGLGGPQYPILGDQVSYETLKVIFKTVLYLKKKHYKFK